MRVTPASRVFALLRYQAAVQAEAAHVSAIIERAAQEISGGGSGEGEA